jgi:hypothetical protein
MRKLIILAASIAALAVPTAAMASVAVDANGYGSVGKGDVQTALGGLTDAQMQTMHKADGVKFTTSYNRVADNTLNCMKYVSGSGFVTTGDTVHQIFTTPVTQNAKATANTNAAGKLTNGWNLTGFDGPATDGPTTSVIEGTCPSGSFVGTTANQVFTDSPSSLKVNGIDLPNTPAV